MDRTLFCLGALAALVLPCRAAEETTGPVTLVRLSVAPAAAPRPALRYRLLPELRELKPGNPIQGYFRAFLVHQRFFLDEEASGRREKLLAMPLRALPAQEMREYGRLVLIEADRAARLDRPDWQVLERLKADGFALLLPDVQQLRSLANAVKVRFRAEVAMGRFDEALHSARTLFAIARHLGEHPTLIGNLVGIAVSFTAIDPLEEMLEQPGCPNLYWALTTLPSPFVSMVVGMDGERELVRTELGVLDEEAPMDAERIKQFAIHWESVLGGNGKPDEPGKRVRAWLEARTRDEVILAAARRRLVEDGLPEDRLRSFPAEQIILLDEKRECQERFDVLAKTITLPHWQFEAFDAPASKPEPSLFADDILAGLKGPRQAQARLEQRIALLRHVEALRLYAAEHRGKLPARLSDISVPLPVDPVTGKPFPYEICNGTAHLRGTPPRGTETTPGYRVHFEVTLQE